MMAHFPSEVEEFYRGVMQGYAQALGIVLPSWDDLPFEERIAWMHEYYERISDEQQP